MSTVNERGIAKAQAQSTEEARAFVEANQGDFVSCTLLNDEVYRIERDSGACWVLPPDFVCKNKLCQVQVDFLESIRKDKT